MVSTRAARGAGAGLLASARTQRVPCVGGSLKQAACVALGSGENMRTLAWALFLKKSSRNSMFLWSRQSRKQEGQFWDLLVLPRSSFVFIFCLCRAWSKLSFHLNSLESLPPSL